MRKASTEETVGKKIQNFKQKSLFFVLNKCSTKLIFYNVQSAAWQSQRCSLTKVCQGHELCNLTKELYLLWGKSLLQAAVPQSTLALLPDQQGQLHLINNDDNNNLHLSLL